MTLWLMPEDEVIRIEAILEREVSAETFASKEITAAQEPLTVLPGGTAVIKIDGVLLNERSEMLDFFGVKQTSYKDIIAQTAEAQNRGAKRSRYEISSPGGQVTGRGFVFWGLFVACVVVLAAYWIWMWWEERR